MGRPMPCPPSNEGMKCTPAQNRVSAHSSSKRVQVNHGPSAISCAGVTPGSIREEPYGMGTLHPKLSVSK
jgi:hypothetical protein